MLAGPAPASVWLLEVPGPGVLSHVQAVDLSGRTLVGPVPLPIGWSAVASVATTKLLLRHSDGRLLVFDPSDRSSGPETGPAADVLDTFGPLVAWLEGTDSGCAPAGCRLHLTDAITGSDQVVTPPGGSPSWIRGGSISPDGHTLAAFVDCATDAGTRRCPGASLVLVDTARGDITPVAGRPVPMGEPVVAADWSASGWLLFSGLEDSMRGYRLGAPAAVVLSLPSSYSFAVS